MSADRWETTIDPQTTPPPGVVIRGDTAIVHGPGYTAEVDISDLAAPTLKSQTHHCPVPGCDFQTASINALGPHLAAHRRRNDPGTPPVKEYVRKPKGKADASKPKPRAKPKLTADDVVNGVLDLLYPVSIPTDRVREVAAWIETTERLARDALADQAEREETP